MKTYEKYKDSDIEWIGEIPTDWNVTRLRYRGKSIIGITYKPDEVSDETNGTLVLRSSNVQNGKLDFKDCVYVDKKIQENQLVKEGDILVCARNGSAHLVGKCAYIPKEWENVSFGAFMSIVRTDLDKFLFYYFNSQVFKGQKGLFATSTINQLTSNMLNNLDIPIPPTKEEQNAIANYLDKKTPEIDQLIAEKEQLVALYQEEKTALINQAVTKGINLDVKLKDSGIEWLGDIPEHWEVKRFKYYFDLITSKIDKELKKIGLENIESKTGKFKVTNTEFAGDGIHFMPNDILFGKLRPYLAKVWLATFEGKAVGDFYSFRVKKEVLPTFAKYRILDESFINITNSSSYGSKMPRVSWEYIANLFIAFPNIKEQTDIVNFVEKESARINAKISKAEQYINLLTEYRTALISEVVTGKIKVIDLK
ncbi:MAG: hypothetical protein Wins2KO_32070 [Winogradskyella sp.]